jgi:cyanophycinase-like exopeptidase
MGVMRHFAVVPATPKPPWPANESSPGAVTYAGPVAAKQRQVFAFSGVLNRPPGEKPGPAFLEYAVSLAAGNGVTWVCFIPTASGDSPGAIEAVTNVFTGREDVDFSVLTLFTQPNVPDVRAHLLGQDVLLAGGGSVVNLMAVWRAHGLAPVMRKCWETGVVLAGWSAGSLCWHVGGPTDSFGNPTPVRETEMTTHVS